jgi:hypothetical protein
MNEYFIVKPHDNSFVYLQRDVKKEKLYLLSIFDCLFSQGIACDDEKLVKLTNCIKDLAIKKDYTDNESKLTYHYYEVNCFYYYTEEEQVFDRQNAYLHLDSIKKHCEDLFKINCLYQELLDYKEKYSDDIKAIKLETLKQFIYPSELNEIQHKAKYYNQKAGPFGNSLAPYVRKWMLVLDDNLEPLSIKECHLIDSFSSAKNFVLFITCDNVSGYVQIIQDDEGAIHSNIVPLENATTFSSVKKVDEILGWVNYDSMTVCEVNIEITEKIKSISKKTHLNTGNSLVLEQVFAQKEKNTLEQSVSTEQLAQRLMESLPIEQIQLKNQLQDFLDAQKNKLQHNSQKMKI